MKKIIFVLLALSSMPAFAATVPLLGVSISGGHYLEPSQVTDIKEAALKNAKNKCTDVGGIVSSEKCTSAKWDGNRNYISMSAEAYTTSCVVMCEIN